MTLDTPTQLLRHSHIPSVTPTSPPSFPQPFRHSHEGGNLAPPNLKPAAALAGPPPRERIIQSIPGCEAGTPQAAM